MAERSLLRALSDNEDNGGNLQDMTPATTRVTRNGGRRTPGAATTTREPIKTTIRPKRPAKEDAATRAPLKCLKLVMVTKPAPKTTSTLDTSRPIRPAADAEVLVTSSANDKDLADTLDRMESYIDDKESFKNTSASIRRKIIKGLKSSFGNRYNGRCTELEKRDFIELWVKLAGIHNDLLTSAAEKDSLGIKINPKWLKEGQEAIVVDLNWTETERAGS